jgi:hypothetical protein
LPADFSSPAVRVDGGIDRGPSMQVQPFPYDEDEKTGMDVDASGGEPLREVSDAPRRRSMAGSFIRRAFLSRDTGRWHQHPGGRDRLDQEPVARRDPGERR